MGTLSDTQICQLDHSIQSERNVFARLLNGLIAAFKKAWKTAANRRSVRPLMTASESELADIGLTPEDVRFIRNSGYFIDHSIELRNRVEARRDNWLNY